MVKMVKLINRKQLEEDSVVTGPALVDSVLEESVELVSVTIFVVVFVVVSTVVSTDVLEEPVHSMKKWSKRYAKLEILMTLKLTLD